MQRGTRGVPRTPAGSGLSSVICVDGIAMLPWREEGQARGPAMLVCIQEHDCCCGWLGRKLLPTTHVVNFDLTVEAVGVALMLRQ